MDESSDKTVTFYITNAHAHPVILQLEPWGEYYEMQRHHIFKVVAIGPDVQPEIVMTENEIYYWASPGSTVHIFDGEKEIALSDMERSRTPLLPTEPLRGILGSP